MKKIIYSIIVILLFCYQISISQIPIIGNFIPPFGGTVTLSETTKNVSSNSGNFAISVDANNSWEIVHNSNWISTNTTSGNSGNTNVIFNYNSTTTARSCQIEFYPYRSVIPVILTINQSAPQPPTKYNVSGGGSYCANDNGVTISLSDSESGVTYELLKNGVNCSQNKSGTGSSLNWYNIKPAGTYTIKGSNSGGSVLMNGSTNVSVIPAIQPDQIVVSQTTINKGQTLTFSSNNGVAYKWSLYKINSSNGLTNLLPLTIETSISYTFNEYGYYKAIMQLLSLCGDDVNETVYIKVIPPTPPTPSVNSVCGYTDVNVSAPPTGVKYYWQTSASGTSKSNSNTSRRFTSSGTYYLRACAEVSAPSAYDAYRWSPAITVPVVVRKGSVNPTSINVSPSGAVVKGTSVSLSKNGGTLGTNALWKWYNQAGSNIGTGSSINYTTTNAETIKVRAEGECDSGKPFVTRSLAVYERETAPSSVSATLQYGRLIPGESATITINGGSPGKKSDGSPAEWKWYSSANSYSSVVATGASITVSPEVTTTYKLKAVGDVYASDVLESVNIPVIKVVKANKSKNYIVTKTAMTGVTSEEEFKHLEDDNMMASVQYFDGLGRPEQQIAVGISSTGKDVVSINEYDQFGREAKQYLPFTAEGGGTFISDALTKQKNFYNNTNNGIDADEKPWSQKVFDGSPLNRIVKQGAAGEAWQPTTTTTTRDIANEKIVSIKYLTNTSPVNYWDVDANNNFTPNNYTASQLYITQTTDEDGKVSEEYKNKLGQVVMKRSKIDNTWAETYYIYDNYGLLRSVVPPQALKNPANDKFCYYYTYDNRRRMITKKVPGMDIVEMVYDNRDMLVLTQDGNAKNFENEVGIAEPYWIFTKYDKFGRTISTGKYKTSKTRSQLQTDVNNHATLWEERLSGNTDHYGYNNSAFPANIAFNDYLSITYYDDYNFNTEGLPSAYQTTTGFSHSHNAAVKTLTTGSKVKVLGENKWLTTVSFYDDYNRVIQTIGKNHLSGTDKVTNEYDFTGNVTKTRHDHNAKPDNSTTNTTYTVKEFVYDHAKRLKYTTISLNGATPFKLSENKYNELGTLTKKKIHGNISSGSFLKETNYNYNIRGWTKGINTNDNTLKFNLIYNYPNGGGYHNGNIRRITWNDSGTDHFYDFTYDGLNRLVSANYNGDPNGNYSMKIPKYDLNGNIKKLVRRGQKTSSLYGDIDNLTYTYDGNRLQSVDDSVTIKTTDSSFYELDIKPIEYEYDYNGNMTADDNKGIKSIDYNILNLPDFIDINGGPGKKGNIRYKYDAAGTKLAKTATGSNIIKTHYVGNHIYKGNNLAYILTDEGRIVFNGNNYNFEYNLTDHLGNVRIVLKDDGTVLQKNSYYPFGSQISALSSSSVSGDTENKYLYNGKEMQDEFGLNNLDYGARFMDPALGRWHTIDPLVEKYYSETPFSYCVNNPISFIDPDGRDVDISKVKKNKKAINSIQDFVNTPEGRRFVLHFLSKDEEFMGVKAKSNGRMHKHTLMFTACVDPTAKGKWKGYLKNSKGNLGKELKKYSTKDFSKLNSIVFTFQLKAGRTKDQMLITIGHEAFTHAIYDIMALDNLFDNIKNFKFENDHQIVAFIKKYIVGTAITDHTRLANGENKRFENYTWQLDQNKGTGTKYQELYNGHVEEYKRFRTKKRSKKKSRIGQSTEHKNR